jgi:hypothetical protein
MKDGAVLACGSSNRRRFNDDSLPQPIRAHDQEEIRMKYRYASKISVCR